MMSLPQRRSRTLKLFHLLSMIVQRHVGRASRLEATSDLIGQPSFIPLLLLWICLERSNLLDLGVGCMLNLLDTAATPEIALKLHLQPCLVCCSNSSTCTCLQLFLAQKLGPSFRIKPGRATQCCIHRSRSGLGFVLSRFDCLLCLQNAYLPFIIVGAAAPEEERELGVLALSVASEGFKRAPIFGHKCCQGVDRLPAPLIIRWPRSGWRSCRG
mmetsp:Transcript_9924/g.36292  ORF Transcript_9924/g.36292 Transcript_9924/m.36292 type:complete len:214 (+) Transcript_9924:1318-1959(+)